MDTSSGRAAGGRARARRGARGLLTIGLTVAALALAAAPAAATESDRWPGSAYEPDRAAHPLRILAYVVHPVGVVLDYTILRPAWWIGQHEPFRTIFGVRG